MSFLPNPCPGRAVQPDASDYELSKAQNQYRNILEEPVILYNMQDKSLQAHIPLIRRI